MAAASADDAANDDVPKVILCGKGRAGKTSILKVVFQKMSPHETLWLERTPKMEVATIARNSLVRFKVHDFPGSTDFDGWCNIVEDTSNQNLFSKACVVVFVIDAQNEPYTDVLTFAKKVIDIAYRINPKIEFDVLIHKVDGDQFFSDDQKTQIQTSIQSDLTEEIKDTEAQISFHCTSIYDHTIFQAFSKIVQKVVPQLSVLEQCLDLLITNSRMEKAFLFDVVSKIYIASDPTPVDLASYELCSDMIDVVIDVSCIYGLSEDSSPAASARPCDEKRSCVIYLKNGNLLYLREVDLCLALVCILREENFDRQYLLDYNIKLFKEALFKICEVSNGK